MSFKTKKYVFVKNAVSLEVANLLYGYFSFKKRVFKKYLDDRFLSPFQTDWGNIGGQIKFLKSSPDTYSHYSDILMETFLEKMRPLMEKKTKLKLYPTYSYARLYLKGDILERHTDRYACDISATLFLGGDAWPIFLDPTGNKGNKEIKVNFEQGDMLIYRGCDLLHWRKPFKKKICFQVFLHYIEQGSQKAEENKFDQRPFLGLSGTYRKGSKYDVD